LNVGIYRRHRGGGGYSGRGAVCEGCRLDAAGGDGSCGCDRPDDCVSSLHKMSDLTFAMRCPNAMLLGTAASLPVPFCRVRAATKTMGSQLVKIWHDHPSKSTSCVWLRGGGGLHLGLELVSEADSVGSSAASSFFRSASWASSASFLALRRSYRHQPL